MQFQEMNGKDIVDDLFSTRDKELDKLNDNDNDNDKSNKTKSKVSKPKKPRKKKEDKLN